MWNWCRRLGLLGFSLAALVPTIVRADPVTLKFAFFAPDTEKTWTTTIKPFIDAVNARKAKASLQSKVIQMGRLAGTWHSSCKWFWMAFPT